MPERMFPERFKGHKQATKNPNHSNATAAVLTHFTLPGHCAVVDMRFIPLEVAATANNNESRRKERQAYLIERGKTLSPDGHQTK